MFSQDQPLGLLNIKKSADRLGTTERWMRRAVAERRLPFVKVGRQVRFRPEDLDAYIERQLVPATGDAA